MKRRIIWKELQKGKIIGIALVIFIAMASGLFASATNLLYSLNSSLNTFSTTAKTSHLLQMHSGALDMDAINKFVVNNDAVDKYEVVRMLNIPGENLYINGNGSNESSSIMDCALVVQNSQFDFLLNSKNAIASVKEGQALIPVYYKIKYNLKIGDSIKIKVGSNYITFKIADFVRDSEMNSSFVSSKRILVNQKDWDKIVNKTGTLEYLIEFRVKDLKNIDNVESAYLEEKLPSNGATITYSEMKFLNSMTDLLTACLMIVIVVFLVIISVFCVRFAMLSSLNQDYMDIAIMQGLGLPNKYIEGIYLIKYAIITTIGCIIGYLVSFRLTPIVEQNLELYMGGTNKGIVDYGLQILATIITGGIIVLLCRKSVKRIEKINTIKALKDNNELSSDQVTRWPSLFGRGGFWTNFKLGIKYLFSYKKPYIVLFLIFTFLSFLVLLPVQLTSTLKSNQFTSYLGVASSDLRIDFQQGGVSEKSVESKFSNLHDVSDYQVFNTYLGKIEGTDGKRVTVNFETGNYSLFTLSCITGSLPKDTSQVAISYLLAKDLDVKVGDKITFTISGSTYNYTVSGIYQDITNGGKSAKSIDRISNANVISSVVNVNVSSEKRRQSVEEKLKDSFRDGKVTDISEYVDQSMGDIINQFFLITTITVIIAILIIIMTITIFMRTLIVRYKADIAVMKALGYKNSDIRTQYRTRIIIPLFLGFIVGSVLVLIVGQPLVGVFTASLGAPQIVFISNPFIVYGLIPIGIFVVAVTTIYLSSNQLNSIKFIQK